MAPDDSFHDTPGNAAELPPEATPATPRLSPRRLAGGALALLLTLIVIGGGYVYAASRQPSPQPVAQAPRSSSPTAVARSTPAPQPTAGSSADALSARYAAFLAQPLTLTHEGRTWQPALAELGGELALGAQPRLSLDQAALQRYVAALAHEVERPAVDAKLTLQGATILTTASQPGLAIALDETLRELTAALTTLQPQTIALRTRALAPTVGDDALAAPQQLIQEYLQAPVTLKVGKQKQVLSVDTLAQLLRVQPNGGQFNVEVDEQALTRLLEGVADATEVGGTRPRVAWDGGKLAIAKPGKPSQRIDVVEARALVLAAITGAKRTISLPVQASPPRITEQTLPQLGIRELVSVGQSDFTGSAAYRVTNIRAGLKLLDGVLIAPGEEFSFNHTVGQIDAASGFVEGYAIIQNRTQLEWGGGICQDSTTLFRAAFWAGLPIAERNQHSFYIKWYDKYGFGAQGDGPGLDAAIFTGQKDLRFTNDTGSWLLIETVVDAKHTLAEVRLYGTKPNRIVRAVSRLYDRTPAPKQARYLPDASIPPGSRKQTDTARGGMTIDVDRIITANGVEAAPERFRTIYKPWPDIFLYNPVVVASPTPVAPPPVDPTPPPVDGAPPAEPPPPVDPPLVEPTAAPPAEPTPPPIAPAE